MADQQPTLHIIGADLKVGDVIDYGSGGFAVVGFDADSPLSGGRIAYDYRNEGFAVYDDALVRIREAGHVG